MNSTEYKAVRSHGVTLRSFQFELSLTQNAVLFTSLPADPRVNVPAFRCGAYCGKVPKP